MTVITQSKGGGFSILWILIFLVGAVFVAPGLLTGFSALDNSASVGSTAQWGDPAEGLVETADEILIGGELVKIARYHPESKEVFNYARDTFGTLPPENFMIRESHQFRNRGYEAILLAVRHPNFGWSGVFIRHWIDNGGCSVPTVFAFTTDSYLQTVVRRDGYIHAILPADLITACGGKFPPAPEFQ